MHHKLFKKVMFLFLTFLLTNTALQAQYNPSAYFKYLEETFNEHQNSLQNILIDELNYFLLLFPDDQNSGRAQFMLASVYNKKGKEHEALAAYLKMIYLYPSSAAVKANVDDLRRLVANERGYRNDQAYLLEIIDEDKGGMTTADSYHRYLEVLVKLQKGGLKDSGIAACRDFIRRFPKDNRHAQAVLWMADFFTASKDYEEANTTYQKFGRIFADSPKMADIRYKQGMLHYKNLRKHEKGLTYLNEMVSKYPSSELVGDATFAIAEIKEEKQKNYDGAILDYQQLVEKYPGNANGAEALWRVGQLYEKKKKDPQQAIAAYNNLLASFPGSERGPKALEEIADLYKNDLDDYENAAVALARIAEAYPEYIKGPDRLIEAGKLVEDKLKDYQKAIDYYQRVVDNFPNSGAVKDANKRIEKATKKLNGE